jgi:hypothetical protein
MGHSRNPKNAVSASGRAGVSAGLSGVARNAPGAATLLSKDFNEDWFKIVMPAYGEDAGKKLQIHQRSAIWRLNDMLLWFNVWA